MFRRKYHYEDTLDGDLRLVAAWADGDDRAGQVLLENNRTALERYLQSRQCGAVDDLVQQVHLACQESIARYNGQQRYQGYMIGIARNLVFRQARQSDKRSREEDVAERAAAPRPTMTPSAVVRSVEMKQLISEALAGLPELQRQVIELYFFEDMTETMIAEKLGKPLGTIKSRKRDAQQKLRHLLERAGASRDQIRLTLVALGDQSARA